MKHPKSFLIANSSYLNGALTKNQPKDTLYLKTIVERYFWVLSMSQFCIILKLQNQIWRSRMRVEYGVFFMFKTKCKLNI